MIASYTSQTSHYNIYNFAKFVSEFSQCLQLKPSLAAQTLHFVNFQQLQIPLEMKIQILKFEREMKKMLSLRAI